MKLQQYIDSVNKDIDFNEVNIKDQSIKVVAKKHYWATHIVKQKIELQNLKNSMNELKVNLMKEYNNAANLNLKLNMHPDVIKLNKEIIEKENIIEYLEKVEKIFQNIHWDIKNMIDLIKLEQL